MPISRVCLIGAGFIADIHAQALTELPDLKPVAIVDPNQRAAKALAKKWGIERTFESVTEVKAWGGFDRAHLLTPPNIHHQPGLEVLHAGFPLLVEKPLAETPEECAEMTTLADEKDVPFGVNQNFIFHPAFLKMKQWIDQGRYGPLRQLECIYNVPLRQLLSRQFGHWMFRQPVNILLEQAVHPLSQIVTLMGAPDRIMALSDAPLEISPGVPFHPACSVTLLNNKVRTSMGFAVGREFPLWQLTAVCDDGAIVADIGQNRTFAYQRSPWLEAADHALCGRNAASMMRKQATKGIIDYARSLVRLKPRCDPFYQSMRNSIAAFHSAINHGNRPQSSGHFGRILVNICEEIASKAYAQPRIPITPPKAAPQTPNADVALLGGTGFIGMHTLRALLEADLRVTVMARTPHNLAPIYQDKRVTVMTGNLLNPDDVARGIGDAPIVINLAHGGGGDSWKSVKASMVGSAEQVAKICLEKKVKHLIHVGSIAGLYLGDPNEIITGSTLPDPQDEQRADYSRAKAVADRLLLEIHQKQGLPVSIFRPGVVVGDGSPPFHSGVGFFNNSQYCLGWNDGTNTLPFVLVEDVADALVLAAQADPAKLAGKTFNLSGDVHMNAQEYIQHLGEALERPLHFVPQSVYKLYSIELGKWLIKRIGGRIVPMPSMRDFRSRGMPAQFDCSDLKTTLNWSPEANTQQFIKRAITLFAEDQTS
ncbi:MAG: NAD-dependent epimerase/dehydratase family protein [Magnetococcales bacterium]|nr:NAD-dependent epimerase/dehydratase family protein [Magnetococcales bacterium]